jgi:mRNA interferase MazF
MAARPLARGDLVLVPFPFTDSLAVKVRPAVVVSTDPRHHDVVLVFVSSRRVGHGGVGEVAVLPSHPEYALSGLVAPSTIRAGKIVTVARALVRRWLGRLGPLLLADLDRALVAALEVSTVIYREEGRRGARARLSALHAAGGPAAVLADLSVEPPRTANRQRAPVISRVPQ